MRSFVATLLLLSALVTLSQCRSADTDYLVNIHTPYGQMKAVLYDDTPEHKENFIELAEEGRYDSTVFHRVIDNFMIQGGDLGMVEGQESVDYTVPYENRPHLIHRKGALAAAREGDQVNPAKASSGSQFYIVEGTQIESEQMLGMALNGSKLQQVVPEAMQNQDLRVFREKYQALYAERDAAGLNDLIWAYRDTIASLVHLRLHEPSAEQKRSYIGKRGAPHLDEGYTVFGQVVEGLEVVEKIAEVKTARGDKPVNDVPMTISLEKMKRKKLAELYGEDYTRGNETD